MEKSLLKYCMRMKTFISEDAIKWILKKTLDALVFLHENSIVHRDIKSDNILYNKEGDIKLADFGYAA